MSYSISLDGEECPTCKHSAAFDFYWNYTSNMGPAWRAAGADLAEYDGKPAAECAPSLDAAIATMEAEPVRFAAFDASNGWGSMETLLPALRKLSRAFVENPAAIVRVSR